MPPRQKVIKSLSKTDKLLLACEWAQCQFVSWDMEEFQLHVTIHLKSLDPSGIFEGDGCLSTNAMDANHEFVCEWRECGSDRAFQSFLEILRHVYFHALHMRLKSIGGVLIEKNSLKGCLMGSTSRNDVPDLGDAFQCNWFNCQAEYDNPHMFYKHVDNHVEALPSGNNVPGGCQCLWTGCDSVMKSKHKLKEHMRSHTQEKLVACPTCGGLFSNTTKFIDHIKRQLDAEVQSYECSHCNNRYGTERLLRDHMRHHVSHYKCPLCDMTCPHPAGLRTHIQYRHSQERPYNCPQCDFGAKTMVDLRAHMMVHSDSWLACEIQDCKFRCRREVQMAHHYKKEHTSEDPAKYICHLCSQRYFRGSRLTKHLKKKHNFKWPAGHNRFRYKQHDDGLFRLQTIRYESIELTEQLLRDKSQEQADAGATSQEEGVDLANPAKEYSYNLEMLGKVAAAVQLPETEKQHTTQGNGSGDEESLGTINEGSEYPSDAESDMTTSTMNSDVTSITVYSREEENIDPQGTSKIRMRYPRVPRKRMQSMENDTETAAKRLRHTDDASNSSLDSYASTQQRHMQGDQETPWDSELQLMRTQYDDRESVTNTPQFTVDGALTDNEPSTSTPNTSSHTTWYLQPGSSQTHNIVVHSDVPVEFASGVGEDTTQGTVVASGNQTPVYSQEVMETCSEALAQDLLQTAGELGITINSK